MGGAGADTLQGGSGIDTASYSRSSAAVQVALGTYKASGGDAEGDTLNGVENLTGSVYDDLLFGSDVANVLTGGGGNDFLSGREGDDTLDGGSWRRPALVAAMARMRWTAVPASMSAFFSESSTGVFVDLLTGQGSGGSAEGDTFWSIENLHGFVLRRYAHWKFRRTTVSWAALAPTS